MSTRAFFVSVVVTWTALAVSSAYFLFGSWQAILAMGFLVALGLRWRERLTINSLNRMERRFHEVAALVFPVVLTGWKTVEEGLGYTDGRGIPNRIQHASWAIAMIGLFLPVFKRWTKDLDVFDTGAITVGCVLALGVGVELLEAMGKVDVPMVVQAEAFRDTMKDFAANLVGAVVGFFGFWWTSGRSLKTSLKVHDGVGAARYG